MMKIKNEWLKVEETRLVAVCVEDEVGNQYECPIIPGLFRDDEEATRFLAKHPTYEKTGAFWLRRNPDQTYIFEGYLPAALGGKFYTPEVDSGCRELLIRDIGRRQAEEAVKAAESARRAAENPTAGLPPIMFVCHP